MKGVEIFGILILQHSANKRSSHEAEIMVSGIGGHSLQTLHEGSPVQQSGNGIKGTKQHRSPRQETLPYAHHKEAYQVE